MACLIFGRETCPTSGRKHFQRFISFKNRHMLSSIKKVAPNAHFVFVRGSVQENIDYFKKDNEFKKFGTCPSSSATNNAY